MDFQTFTSFHPILLLCFSNPLFTPYMCFFYIHMYCTLFPLPKIVTLQLSVNHLAFIIHTLFLKQGDECMRLYIFIDPWYYQDSRLNKIINNFSEQRMRGVNPHSSCKHLSAQRHSGQAYNLSWVQDLCQCCYQWLTQLVAVGQAGLSLPIWKWIKTQLWIPALKFFHCCLWKKTNKKTHQTISPPQTVSIQRCSTQFVTSDNFSFL